MNFTASSDSAGMNMIGSSLVVTIKGNLDEQIMIQIRKDILSNIKKFGAKEALIDVSFISILDLSVFTILRETARMISVLGAGVVFVGFQAGVASTLVDLDADLEGLPTAVTMDDGFEVLRCKDSVPIPEEN